MARLHHRLSSESMIIKRSLLLAVVVVVAVAAAVAAAADATIASDDEGYDMQEDDGRSAKNRVDFGGTSTEVLSQTRNLYEEAEHYKDCGFHKPRASVDRIAGGYNADLGEYPSFVHMKIGFLGNKTKKVEWKACGGTILGKRLVLTAAHCFIDDQLDRLIAVKIYAGSLKRNTGAQVVNASHVCFSKEKAGFRAYDLASIYLKKNIKYTGNVQPACLPKSDITHDQQAYAVGSGYVSKSPAKEFAKTLQVLPAKKSQKCPFRNADATLNVCFISNESKYKGDICEGDSGGPLYANIDNKQTVIGVVSGGKNLCMAGKSYTSLYMNLYTSKFRDMVGRCHPILDPRAPATTKKPQPEPEPEPEPDEPTTTNRPRPKPSSTKRPRTSPRPNPTYPPEPTDEPDYTTRPPRTNRPRPTRPQSTRKPCTRPSCTDGSGCTKSPSCNKTPNCNKTPDCDKKLGCINPNLGGGCTKKPGTTETPRKCLNPVTCKTPGCMKKTKCTKNPETDPESNFESDLELESDSDSESSLGTELSSESDSELDSESESNSESEANSESNLDSESSLESELTSESDSELDSDSESKSESRK